jgi:hypothetical protein
VFKKIEEIKQSPTTELVLGLPIENRTCFNCIDKVEDEVHVLLHCPVYDHIRHTMLHEAQVISDNFIVLNMEEQFNCLLSNTCMTKCVAKICHDILSFRRKVLYTE